MAYRLKVKIVVSIQLKRALHDNSQGLRVLSREMICHYLKKKIMIKDKDNNLTHYVITLERSHVT